MKEINKLVKVAAIAVPLFVLASCSSTQHSKMNEGAAVSDNSVTLSHKSDDQTSSNIAQDIQQLQQQQMNTVYFAYDKYNISAEYADNLAKQATFLREHPSIDIVIQGYTDERGTPEYNIALGERRANAVKMYLQGQGVAANQITTISYGKEKPAVLGHSEAAYAKNRRAVIVYPTINN